MKWPVICLATILSMFAPWPTCAVAGQSLTGVGASFPAPIYTQWADRYHRQTGNRINYQSLGSNAGIQQVRVGTVDFAGSDMPLPPEALHRAGLIQFPMLIGGVVPVVNIRGIVSGQLQLDGVVLADIYLGRILRWNDPAILRLNPGLSLPDAPIMPIRRADGAGATFAFTEYLSRSHRQWQAQIGAGASVRWSTGAAGKGNEGVAAFVQRLPDSIGYVEYSYALQNRMSMVALRNDVGIRVVPGDAGFHAALAHTRWSPGFVPTTRPDAGERAWPIMTATFVLMRRDRDPVKTAVALDFFDWAYAHGDDMARALGYFPMPPELKAQVRAYWCEETLPVSGCTAITGPVSAREAGHL